MCELATISLVASGLGTVMSAVGGMQQANAQAAQADYQRQVAQQNQQLALRQADDALVRSAIEQRDIKERGRVEEQRYRVAAAELIGTQRAGLAASGAELGSDTSAGRSLIESRMTAELDAQTIRDNVHRALWERAYAGEQEAWGHQVGASNYANQQAMLAAEARNARKAGAFAAGTTLLSGAGNVAGKWYQFDRMGAWG